MPGATARAGCIAMAPSTETPTSNSLTPLVNGPRSTCRNNVPGRQLDCLSHAAIASPNPPTTAAITTAAIVNRDGDRIDDLVLPLKGFERLAHPRPRTSGLGLLAPDPGLRPEVRALGSEVLSSNQSSSLWRATSCLARSRTWARETSRSATRAGSPWYRAPRRPLRRPPRTR